MLRVNRVGERRRPGIGFFILLVLLLLPRTAVFLLFMFQKAYAPLHRSLSDLVEAIAEPWRDLDGHPAAEVPLSTRRTVLGSVLATQTLFPASEVDPVRRPHAFGAGCRLGEVYPRLTVFGRWESSGASTGAGCIARIAKRLVPRARLSRAHCAISRAVPEHS